MSLPIYSFSEPITEPDILASIRALPTEDDLDQLGMNTPRQKEEIRRRAELYDLLYADLLEGRNQRARLYETVPLPQPDAGESLPIIDLADTVDGCLWIALVARRGETPDQARDGLSSSPSCRAAGSSKAGLCEATCELQVAPEQPSRI